MTVSPNIYEEQQTHSSDLHLGQVVKKRVAPVAQVPSILGPQTPSWAGSFVHCKQKGGVCSSRSSVAGSGRGKAMCQETTGREGAIFPPDLGRENQVPNLPHSRASRKLSEPESNIDPLP